MYLTIISPLVIKSENIKIIQDENISTLSENILIKNFREKCLKIGLRNWRNFFLKVQIERLFRLNFDISQPIDLKNMIGISGKINGQVKINVKEEEIALLLFMQLSQDIEDFEQINQLINTLSQSFINNDILSKVK